MLTAAKSKLILIVDDDSDLRRIFRTSLRLAGYEVQEASDGFSALVLLEQHPPDLVVLDIALPTLSGISVRQEIAAHAVTRDIPVIVVTGMDLDERALNVPCVLRKPVTPDELIRAVQSCLNSGAPGAGS